MAGSDWLGLDSSQRTTSQGDRRRSPRPDSRVRGPGRRGACATRVERLSRRQRRFAQNASARRQSNAARETLQWWQPGRSRRRTRGRDRSRTRSLLWGESAWLRKSTYPTQTVRSRRRETAPGWSGSSLEDRHLRWRTDIGIIGSDTLKRDFVAEPCRDRLRPAAEVFAVPFESVVGMTVLAGWERSETHVLLGVGGRQGADPRRGEFEY